MLANINRLRKDHEIKKVFAKGKQTKSSNFSLRYLPNHFGESRFAIVVGTKADKRSARRNALKRQMRVIVRRNLGNFPRGFNFVLIAYKIPSWPLSQSDLEKELTELIKIKKIK